VLTASAISSSVATPPFIAVFIIPSPNGFVKIRISPTLAEEFFQTLLG